MTNTHCAACGKIDKPYAYLGEQPVCCYKCLVRLGALMLKRAKG